MSDVYEQFKQARAVAEAKGAMLNTAVELVDPPSANGLGGGVCTVKVCLTVRPLENERAWPDVEALGMGRNPIEAEGTALGRALRYLGYTD